MKLKISQLDEVIAEANKKKLKPYHIAQGTNLAPSTVWRYFTGQQISMRSVFKIIEYINSVK